MDSDEQPTEQRVLAFLNLAIIFLLLLAAMAVVCCWAFIPHQPSAR